MVSIGAWFVVPFTGLELLALYWVLYVVSLKLNKTHVIRFVADQVVIEKGFYFPNRKWQLKKSETSIVVEKGRHELDVDTILLCDPEQQIVVGDFLSKDEAELLYESLRKFSLHTRSHSRPAPVQV